MRLLILMLMLLLGGVPASAAEFDVPASTKDMVHLSVTATNVRLRAGAGTEFEVLGMASRDAFSASRYVADAQPRMDSTGKPWFRLLASLEQQTELSICELDRPCWIRGDFVKTRALREREAQLADNTFFHILHISLDGMSGVACFTPKTDLPVCAEENDCLFVKGRPVVNKYLPAGELYLIWTMPSKSEAGNVCISVWKKLDKNRIQCMGTMPREQFESFDFGSDQSTIKRWKSKQPAHYWE